MAFRADKKEEKGITIEDLKETFKDLHDQARAFMNYYKYMKTKERAQKLQALTNAWQRLAQNIEIFKTQPVTNPAIKFSYEVFRQNYQSFLPRWRKFEAKLLGLALD
jgi:hypothetical protein